VRSNDCYAGRVRTLNWYAEGPALDVDGPDGAPLARNAARVVGLADTPRTCPFACIVAADPWVVEITRAAGIAHDYHTPLDAILQRPLTAADIDALDAMRSGQHDAWTSDRAIEDAERKSRSSP
jgi:hypothetical protein